METEQIFEDGNFPITISPGQHEFFMSHGKQGIDAEIVYIHLIYTARRQRTNQVWAAVRYICSGIAMGQRRVMTAKKFLADHGLIEYIHYIDKATKRHTKTFIRLRYIQKMETILAMAEEIAAAGGGSAGTVIETYSGSTETDTADLESYPQATMSVSAIVETLHSGNDYEMLKVKKEMLKEKKEKEFPREENSLFQKMQSIYKAKYGKFQNITETQRERLIKIAKQFDGESAFLEVYEFFLKSECEDNHPVGYFIKQESEDSEWTIKRNQAAGNVGDRAITEYNPYRQKEPEGDVFRDILSAFTTYPAEAVK